MEGKKGIIDLRNVIYINNEVTLVTCINYNWNNAYEIELTQQL